MTIRYRGGYKYQLAETYSEIFDRLKGLVDEAVSLDGYLELEPDGRLTIKRGYAWDGPSGPTFDTATFMRASLVHDALYQLLRAGALPPSCRAIADLILRDVCREDGMWELRARWAYRGVRLGAGYAADPKSRKPILEAP